ncbi:hypothetical protein ACPCA8_08965 [Streptomyces capoamus]|uniref:hypothetical protein n=1 Tax=Streptomyces capoamus TaxID=68183 RepID=UPI003C2EA8D6
MIALLCQSGCTSRPAPHSLSPDDTIKAAQQVLTDRCLTRQGLTPPRPGQRPRSSAQQQRIADALFGRPPAELSLILANGVPVRAHTDGCLAAAQRTLYGDEKRWFEVSTVVNNLKSEATYRKTSLSAVRVRHHSELTEWRRLRSHALDTSARVLRGAGHRDT